MVLIIADGGNGQHVIRGRDSLAPLLDFHVPAWLKFQMPHLATTQWGFERGWVSQVDSFEHLW